MLEDIKIMIDEHLPKVSRKKRDELADALHAVFDPDMANGFDVIGAHIATETIDFGGTLVGLDVTGNVVSVRVPEKVRIEVTWP